jgi:hypothetical protein
MKRLLRAFLPIALAAAFSTSLLAAELPEVKVSASNQVPECATPGRLSAYLQTRNPRLDPRFEGVATQYMRHGEALGLRWDIAFFQMILETGALRFGGDVKPSQNNFAGLGASGGGARGESFSDVSNGVKAHLQHLLMYAGDHIDDPVAERTRKVQEWGVLTAWQKSIEGPMTFTLVAQQWAPTSRNYGRDVSTINDEFYNQFCNADDPRPELVQEAREGRQPPATTATAKAKKAKAETEVAAVAKPAAEEQPVALPTQKGADVAKQRIEEERKENPPIKALGAGMIGSVTKTAATEKPPAAAEDSPPVTLLNAKQPEAAPATAEAGPETKAPAAKTDTKAKSKAEAKPAVAKADVKADTKGAQVQTASIGSAATQLKVPPAKGDAKCKVWTASYGGQRAVIIKANATGTGTVNYTVLDVTEANEKREVDAYIAAYAKGGEKVASFPTQNKALNKAFELCPEG